MTGRFGAKDIALLGLFAALTATLTVAESWLPPLPVPGTRLGLANVAVTAGMWIAGPCAGIVLGFFKVLVTLLTRGVTAAIMAFCGTTLAVAMTALCMPLVKKQRFTFVGVSVAAAGAHTVGQLIGGSLLLSTAVVTYAPLLLSVAVVSGTLTGELLNLIIPRLPQRQAVFKEMNSDKERT